MKENHLENNGRREPRDRRTSGDRRRNAELRVPIFHVGHSIVRLAVVVDRPAEEENLVVTRSIPWRKEADVLHSAQGIAELTEALSTLASNERLSGTRARVLLNSDLCVTRAVAGAQEDVQRESALLRERSQLYLSLGPGKKVISSSSTQLDARHSHALLTVATQETLSVVSRAVEAAGMQLDAIESAQVALARLVGLVGEGDKEEASIVVQVDEGGIELGVMSDGRLLLDYLPGGQTNVDQLAELFGQHHARLQRYCQRHHGLQGTKLDRVYVSGEETDVQEALDNLQTLPDLDVTLLDLRDIDFPWEFRGEEVAPEMACVLGAALVLSDHDYASSPNLIEQLLASARPPIAKMLFRKFAPLAAAVLVGVVFGLLNWQAKHQVSLMKAELQVHAPEAARATLLRLKGLAADNQLRQLAALSDQLPAQPLALLLKNMTESIPSEVWLTGLRIQSASSAQVTGSSFSESSIYDFVGHLQHVPGIADVALESTGVGRTQGGNATTFDLNLDLLLQGRNDQKGETL